jgi:hypothetical protein
MDGVRGLGGIMKARGDGGGGGRPAAKYLNLTENPYSGSYGRLSVFHRHHAKSLIAETYTARQRSNKRNPSSIEGDTATGRT